ncbi:ribosomal RNA processing protein 1 homolog B isoform X2 [Hippoglossus stenolepis]|uniref:ribosomal RNA processing protein 1 homolog B isoform X2 n=1 Tax=Hippoglossus stenolepis TaxID=195615 RepID=UPI00159C721D|nr:ribosomal RNA processing protein 1 homolog B isoform X2 [Hippoglossus stenolepis]
MASVQDPEIQFAQKLASNEKPVRTKAIKKLKKYINVRSQKETDGFTDDELLKLWKGLFYCLWMQDKPLLQEDLSNQISNLIHSFHHIDGQFLYLESFLQTFKREWTGIDRLRMDKFFQLVRLMFKQTFEMLKRKNWESSVVARFLELLTAQLLRGGSAAPSGLQFHILDLYMTELAAVGSSELTANQNLMFIEPFCKTAAKTKDRTLFRAICNSIFSSIIDQAPFAIEELMQEVNAAEDSDSGQASEGDDKDQIKGKISKPLCKKWTRMKINGSKSNQEEDDELLYSDDSDTELPCDGDIGPVLQFDYTALAEKLFELASRSSTPSQNRQRLYKIIKVLQDLGEGIFPQDVYPEEVSTDEDDEMFGSRKRMKRGCRPMDEDQKGTPAAKKRKKKEASTLGKQNKDLVKHDSERVDQTNNDGGKKKKRKKKKAEQGGSVQSEENTERSKQGQTMDQSQTPIKEIEEAEGIPQCAQAEDLEKEAEVKIHILTAKVTEATTAQDQSETLLISEVNKQPSVTVTEEAAQPRSCTNDKDQTESFSKKKKRDTSESKPGIVAVEDKETFPTTEPEMSSQADASVSGKRNKKKSLKAQEQTDGIKTLSQVSAETEITSVSCETAAEETVTKMTTLQTDAGFPTKKRMGMKAEFKPEGESQIHNGSSEAKTKFKEPSDATTAAKSKKKILKVNAQVEVEDKPQLASEATQHTTSVPIERKKKGKQKIEQKLLTTLAKKKDTPKMATMQLKDETQLQMVGSLDSELPLKETEAIFSKRKLTKKKKRKIPVVFEFETDQLVATAREVAMINAEEETCAKKKKLGNDVKKPSTHLSAKTSQKKLMTAAWLASDFITFQSNTVAPVPLFCKSKGNLSNPLYSKKKSQTPESKKVTFGLKNNKTAEFRKTDRSLLVSPDGSSRVPFDPKQKPKFGVLKSPPTPGSTNLKTTPKVNRKKSLNSLTTTPKRRPSAADFF